MRAGLRINPVGAALTFGYALNILALHYEASEIQTGLLYAGPLVIGFFGMLVPMFFAGVDTTKIMVRFWILQSIVGCVFLFIPFLATNEQKVWLIVSGSYGFLFVRIFASTAWPSVCRGFSKTRDDLKNLIALEITAPLPISMLLRKYLPMSKHRSFAEQNKSNLEVSLKVCYFQ